MRPSSRGLPARPTSGPPSAGASAANGFDASALDACQLLWLGGAGRPLGRLAAWRLLALGKALGLRRRAMALLSVLRRVPAEPYGGWMRWTDAGDGTVAAGVPGRPAGGGTLRAGDVVEVRTLDEIRATLDVDGRLDGLKFLRPMEQYCGRRFRVFKPVRRFFDERDRAMRTVRDTVLLEGAVCHGQGMRGKEGCDRSCFFYWKEAWLRKIKEREHGS